MRFLVTGGSGYISNILVDRLLARKHEVRDAMENPEDYHWIIVRISGYYTYFVRLNKNMQIELIERKEFSS